MCGGQINKARYIKGLTLNSPEKMTLTHAKNIIYVYTLNLELYIPIQGLKSDDTNREKLELRQAKRSQSKNPVSKYE